MVAGTKQKLIIKVLAAITVHIYGGGVISNFYFLLPILFFPKLRKENLLHNKYTYCNITYCNIRVKLLDLCIW